MGVRRAAVREEQLPPLLVAAAVVHHEAPTASIVPDAAREWACGADFVETQWPERELGALEHELWNWSSGTGAPEVELWNWTSGAGALELEL